jgi:hypothetical protein
VVPEGGPVLELEAQLDVARHRHEHVAQAVDEGGADEAGVRDEAVHPVALVREVLREMPPLSTGGA